MSSLRQKIPLLRAAGIREIVFSNHGSETGNFSVERAVNQDGIEIHAPASYLGRLPSSFGFFSDAEYDGGSSILVSVGPPRRVEYNICHDIIDDIEQSFQIEPTGDLPQRLILRTDFADDDPAALTAEPADHFADEHATDHQSSVISRLRATGRIFSDEEVGSFVEKAPEFGPMRTSEDFQLLVALDEMQRSPMILSLSFSSGDELPDVSMPRNNATIFKAIRHAARSRALENWPWMPSRFEESPGEVGGWLSGIIQGSAAFRNLLADAYRIDGPETQKITQGEDDWPTSILVKYDADRRSALMSQQLFSFVADSCSAIMINFDKDLEALKDEFLRRQLPFSPEILSDARANRKGWDDPEDFCGDEELKDRLVWYLALDESDPIKRQEKSSNRKQALAVYGGLFDTLRDSKITNAIDEARPINELLRDALGGAPRSLLSRIRYKVSPDRVFASRLCLTGAASRMVYFGLNPAEFPSEIEEWRKSPFTHTANFRVTLGEVRNDFRFYEVSIDGYPVPRKISLQSADFDDATHAFYTHCIDAAISLALQASAKRKPALWSFRRGDYSLSCLNSGWGYGDPSYGVPIWYIPMRSVSRLFQKALIGKRSVESFRRSVFRSHGFSDSIEALRAEVMSDASPWPVMVDPWVSKCGSFSIRALGSAKDLAIEGVKMRHCVGSYAEKCRDGLAQILAISGPDGTSSTVEVSVPVDHEAIGSYEVVQFRGFANSEPSSEHKSILNEFLEDIRSGRHLVRISDMNPSNFHGKSDNRAPETLKSRLRFAELVFPIYRDSLLSGLPKAMSHAEWLRHTGLSDAIMTAVSEIEVLLEREVKDAANNKPSKIDTAYQSQAGRAQFLDFDIDDDAAPNDAPSR